MLYYERRFKKKGYDIIIGVDEVGRGPLAGPVVAGAVILKTNRFKNRIDDSKKLTPKGRVKAYFELIKKSLFGIGIVNERVIDRLNIAQATRIAMEEAISMVIDRLTPPLPRPCTQERGLRAGAGLKPAKKQHIYILIDGNVKLKTDLPYLNIIRGDSKSKSIAGASILAKVIRDRIMTLYDKIYPEYGFIENKGYPTRKHLIALKKFGPSKIHRMSFCV